MSGHQSARMKSDTYLTPPEWIDKLGPFDLDPCCPPNMPWPTAVRMLTKADDGLSAPWKGRVWMNPPFGQQAALWFRKKVQHGNGIALIPARTETDMFDESLWAAATGICFVHGRPHFYAAEDTMVMHAGKEVFVARGTRFPFNSGAPIALAAYGLENVEKLIASRLGRVITNWTGRNERWAA